nr:OmpA family protein [Gymnodinialimonas phycosphaerae]
MISRGGATGFVHLSLIQPPSQAEAPVIQSTRTPDPGTELPETPPTDLIALLTAFGAAPLEDLQFQTGAAELSGERYASLTALAAFLAEDPTRQVVLVGHTDALGSLSGNIALSRARALAVRQFLTEELGVVPTQVEAQGIGFLSPRAPNTTPEGREANRRVEVVLANP